MKQRSPKANGSPTRAELLARVAALEKRLRAATRARARKDGQAQALARELAETREQQTATSEILRVISRSQTDVQPVFDTIVRSAARLCDGLFSALYQFDGELLDLVAQHNYTPEAIVDVHRIFPARPIRSISDRIVRQKSTFMLTV